LTFIQTGSCNRFDDQVRNSGLGGEPENRVRAVIIVQPPQRFNVSAISGREIVEGVKQDRDLCDRIIWRVLVHKRPKRRQLVALKSPLGVVKPLMASDLIPELRPEPFQVV